MLRQQVQLTARQDETQQAQKIRIDIMILFGWREGREKGLLQCMCVFSAIYFIHTVFITVGDPDYCIEMSSIPNAIISCLHVFPPLIVHN